MSQLLHIHTYRPLKIYDSKISCAKCVLFFVFFIHFVSLFPRSHLFIAEKKWIQMSLHKAAAAAAVKKDWQKYIAQKMFSLLSWETCMRALVSLNELWGHRLSFMFTFVKQTFAIRITEYHLLAILTHKKNVANISYTTKYHHNTNFRKILRLLGRMSTCSVCLIFSVMCVFCHIIIRSEIHRFQSNHVEKILKIFVNAKMTHPKS